MSTRSNRAAAITAVASLTLLAGLSTSTARADEGMWLLNQPPMRMLKQRYGFTPSAQWLELVRKASVRMGWGGSGPIVSEDGLVMTNHHVARSQLAKLSTPQRDIITNGFLAREPADELKCPDLEVLSLQDIVDVTDRIKGAIGQNMTDAQADDACRAVIATVEGEYNDKTGLLDTPFDLVSTNDIISGNSGIPLINTDGKVVGLIFDGNRYPFAWDTIYSSEQGRAVSVDVRAIVEALRKVYGADALANELAGR